MSMMRLLSSGKSWVGLKDSGIRYRMTNPKAMPKFGSEKNLFRATAKAPPPEAISIRSVTLGACLDYGAQASDVPRSEGRFERAEETGGDGSSSRNVPCESVGTSRPHPFIESAPSQGQPERAEKPLSSSSFVKSTAEDWPALSPFPAGRDGERGSASKGIGLGKRIGQASAAVFGSARTVLFGAVARLSKVNLLKAGRRGSPARARTEPGAFTKAPVQGELSLDRIKVVRNDLSDADLEIVPARPKPVEVEAALQT
jgi:hypothetical protein